MTSPMVASPAAASSEAPDRYPVANPVTAPAVPHTSASPKRSRHACHFPRTSMLAPHTRCDLEGASAVLTHDLNPIVPACARRRLTLDRRCPRLGGAGLLVGQLPQPLLARAGYPGRHAQPAQLLARRGH